MGGEERKGDRRGGEEKGRVGASTTPPKKNIYWPRTAAVRVLTFEATSGVLVC